jgi:hypothetical protein
LIHGAVLIYIVFKIPAKAAASAGHAFESDVTVVALVDAAIGLFAPRVLGWFAKRAPNVGTETDPSRTWLKSRLIGLAFIHSCNLFALALHLIGNDLDMLSYYSAWG